MIISPTTIEEACRAHADHLDSSLLSGGTDFMVEVNFNHRKPQTVINLGDIEELHQWSIDNDNRFLRIGAAVPFAEMENGPIAKACPALAQAARTVGSPPIRTSASIGGNLGTASPAGDSLPVLSALDASIEVASIAGRRDISIHDFLLAPKRNALAKHEIISAITLPITDCPQEFAKVGVRNAMVISIASASFAVHSSTCRIALGSVGPTVLRCPDAEEFLTHHYQQSTVTEAVIEEFAQLAAAAARPIDDHRSTAAYRTHAVQVLARRLAQRSLSNE